MKADAAAYPEVKANTASPYSSSSGPERVIFWWQGMKEDLRKPAAGAAAREVDEWKAFCHGPGAFCG